MGLYIKKQKENNRKHAQTKTYQLKKKNKETGYNRRK
jgi:hypothetical protein